VGVEVVVGGMQGEIEVIETQEVICPACLFELRTGLRRHFRLPRLGLSLQTTKVNCYNNMFL
jgi:hypothetical protein